MKLSIASKSTLIDCRDISLKLPRIHLLWYPIKETVVNQSVPQIPYESKIVCMAFGNSLQLYMI